MKQKAKVDVSVNWLKLLAHAHYLVCTRDIIKWPVYIRDFMRYLIFVQMAPLSL